MRDFSCPANIDELADAYCLGQLEPAAAKAFEEHYLVCPRCAGVASDTYDFIEAFRLAAAASTGVARSRNAGSLGELL